jgi:DNA-binding SARP family transcriptional activator
MAQLCICLLEPFHVTFDGEPVTTFEWDKVHALLAYLAVGADQPHSREKLAGLLWPKRPETSARTNLRRALSDLCSAISTSTSKRSSSTGRVTPGCREQI